MAERFPTLKRLVWPLLLAFTIFLASGTSEIAAPDVVSFDKLAHFLVFGLIGILVLRCRKAITWKWAITAFLITSLYGGLDEYRQSFTPGRSVEWYDWYADTLGAFVSIFLYKTVPLYSKLLELKFFSKSGQAEPALNNQ